MMSAVSAEMEVARASDVGLLRAVTTRYPVRGARLTLTNDFPVGAGLGGSSAAGVATIAAAFKWRGESRGREEIAEASRDIEVTQLGIAGGRQDHYAAALGGALALRFGRHVTAQSIPMSPATVGELPRRCLVLYTGESRVSANTITAVLGAYRAGNRAVTAALGRMRELAEEMSAALTRADFDALGELVDEHWRHQRTLDPAIPTPLIDDVIAKATRAGATGCKALGASGGGCVLVIAPVDRAENVRRAIAPLGTPIDFAVDTLGVQLCE